MPSVHFDGQSFSVKGRRIWLTAAELEYALLPMEEWPAHLDAARAAGFNAIVANCPWSLHEARNGRFSFNESLDVAAFAALCAQRDLWLVLRIGPAVGGTFDGGGLPAWLSDLPGIRLREANPVFFDRVTRWFRALADQVAARQATEPGTKGRETGPLVAIQIEDDWACGSQSRAEAYLSELVRFAREVGFAVPILTANRAWASVEGATDTWSGWNDLAATMRQLAHLEPERPRVVALRDPEALRFTSSGRERKRATPDPAAAMVRCARVLASGGQCIVADAFTLTHHGPTGGRFTVGERPEGFLATTARVGVLFDEGLAPQPGSGLLRRLLAFSGSFGATLAQATYTHQPVVADPESSTHSSIVPVTGPGGTIVFLFRGANEADPDTWLLLPDGRRMQAHAGSAAVSWFAFDVDLQGAGVLDYASISPLALLEKRQLVLFGPAGIHAELSIDGVPLTVHVPPAGAAKPTVHTVRHLTLVVCNEEQVDRARPGHDGIAIGDVQVGLDGKIAALGAKPAAKSAAKASFAVRDWTVSSCRTHAAGSSDRFATLDGPASLARCGAREGYGWYRLRFRRPGKASSTLAMHAPSLADRATVWIGGTRLGTFGAGPGARRFPVDVTLPAGEVTVSVLVEQLGRPVAGDHLGRRGGLFGHFCEVVPMKASPTRDTGKAVSPFSLRGFNYGVNEGDLGSGSAVAWRVTMKRKTGLLLDLGAAALPGMLVVSGAVVARVGADGPQDGYLTLDAGLLAQGANEIRLVLDGDPPAKAIDALRAAATLHEIVQPLGADASWSFARWAPPVTWGHGDKAEAGVPAWMRGVVTVPDVSGPLWLDLAALGRGRAFVNGRAVGRYEARDPGGKVSGGQSSLYVPATWLVAGKNEIVLFDEYGAVPRSVMLRSR